MTPRALLIDAFREAFPSVSPDLIPSASMETLADWNSLGFARLIVAVERRINRTIETERLADLTSFAAFESYLSGNLSRRFKGIIIDLDNTLWNGVLVEDGNATLNTAFADFLQERRAQGILVAVASKNDPVALILHVVERLPDATHILSNAFPMIVSWRPKSEAVTDILRAWNISASDVVMVDDSAAELHEVQRVHPDIHGVIMTGGVPPELYDLPWATSTTEEARLRMDSVIANANFVREAEASTDLTAFLRDLYGVIVVSDGWTPRVQELCERTNQFNLNGIRWSREELTAPGMVVLSFDYMDRFGRMGVVGAVCVRIVPEHTNAVVQGWWLSCRAFQRRIEYHMLDVLLARFPDSLSFAYKQTEQNALVREFLDARLTPVERPHRVMYAARRDS